MPTFICICEWNGMNGGRAATEIRNVLIFIDFHVRLDIGAAVGLDVIIFY